MSKQSVSFQYGQHQVRLETGEIARQASGAVMVHMGQTVVLVTVVGAKHARPDADFFPLTVDYQERFYAAGRIPGGFFKREGKPTERETLISRLIDRPLRPLFPKGFYNEVQIIATVFSLDPEIDPDIPALLGASAALAISGLPFEGPVGAARVGYREGELLLNPGGSDLAESALDLVVAGTEDAILMVESEAAELAEEVMLDAVMFGHAACQRAIAEIRNLVQQVSPVAWDWQPSSHDEDLIGQVEASAGEALRGAYATAEKQARHIAIAAAREQAVAALVTGAEGAPDAGAVDRAFHELEARVVRGRILDGQPRIDGRDLTTVRPITVETGVLPRTHGSALFTRGETQALVVTTLGTAKEAQIIDDIDGERRDSFMLHYNFPPYSVGETGRLGGPKRREVGHGNLARRGLSAVLPEETEFPYVIRVVSEITESNGSSSMATVCGGSLSLMDAGVPTLAPVAGVAMGLIKEGDRFAVLTDILGDEDHLGDMDFKVAGTEEGVTALQMDIKITGITREIMAQALAQAREGRLHILGIMNAHLAQPRGDVSQHAPRYLRFKINPEKIREVIGKGGVTIRALTEETGTQIDLTDDGNVTIAATNQSAAAEARRRIEEITAELEVGKVYDGVVTRIMDFGAVVSIAPGRDGLVHISQIAHQRIEKVSDHLKEGDKVHVKVIELDRQGRVRLSMKDAQAD